VVSRRGIISNPEGGGCVCVRVCVTFLSQLFEGQERGGAGTLEYQENGETPLVDAEDSVGGSGKHKS
jgi:hypothetical protein